MSDAEYAYDQFHARLADWPGLRFKASPHAKKEVDKTLKGVVFFRYPDGSVIRKDGPDLIECF